MKKFLLIFVVLFSFSLCFQPLFARGLEQQEGVIICSQCSVYTQANFQSQKLQTPSGEEIKLKHGQKVQIIDLSGDFAHISFDAGEGFVYSFYITTNTSPAVYPVFNASIRNDTTLYDIDGQETTWTVKKSSRAYIYRGFDDKEGFTSVQVVLEDGSIYNGLVKTEDLKPDGISAMLVVGISIIIAAATIILSLIFIKKKKKSK